MSANDRILLDKSASTGAWKKAPISKRISIFESFAANPILKVSASAQEDLPSHGAI